MQVLGVAADRVQETQERGDTDITREDEEVPGVEPRRKLEIEFLVHSCDFRTDASLAYFFTPSGLRCGRSLFREFLSGTRYRSILPGARFW